jgi:hypothetical protein
MFMTPIANVGATEDGALLLRFVFLGSLHMGPLVRY